MAKIVVKCPACEGELLATRLGCPSCATQLEGQFEFPALLRLGADDLSFVTAFVRSSGSLKAMAERDGVSYPTVRNRLDEIIRRLDDTATRGEKTRHEILDALEKGAMSAKAAAAALRKVQR